MLRAGLALWLLFCSLPLAAKVHYINQGVKYHVGDDRFNTSVDSQFLDAWPVTGQEWIQAFTVNEEDSVRVSIDHVWGVDDCAYCLVLVSIGDHDMGRLTAENNHEPFETLKPLAMKVYPGRTYYLKIASYGKTSVDDFAIEGVRVETEKADVTFMKPGPILKMPSDPMPQVSRPEPPRGPCEGVSQKKGWMPEEARAKGMLEFDSEAPASERNSILELAPGDFAQVYAFVQKSGEGDAVNQALEFLVGEPGSGWVLTFRAGTASATHGNTRLQGRYMGSRFGLEGWKEGAWNELRLARCPDGKARFWINGRDTGVSLDLGPETLRLRFKALGVSARLAEQPY